MNLKSKIKQLEEKINDYNGNQAKRLLVVYIRDGEKDEDKILSDVKNEIREKHGKAAADNIGLVIFIRLFGESERIGQYFLLQ